MKSNVKVKDVEYGDFKWQSNEDNSKFTLTNTAKITLTLNDGKLYTFTFKKNCICDGLSVPKAFQWFLPKWSKNNALYNLAGALHDALYANKGFGVFNRDDSDAIFRGLLREAGCNRFHASTADFILWLFGCSHWGDDIFKCKNLVTMKTVE